MPVRDINILYIDGILRVRIAIDLYRNPPEKLLGGNIDRNLYVAIATDINTPDINIDVSFSGGLR